MTTKHIFLTKKFLYQLSKENAKGLIDLLYQLNIKHPLLSYERIEEKLINKSIDSEGIEIKKKKHVESIVYGSVT